MSFFISSLIEYYFFPLKSSLIYACLFRTLHFIPIYTVLCEKIVLISYKVLRRKSLLLALDWIRFLFVVTLATMLIIYRMLQIYCGTQRFLYAILG